MVEIESINIIRIAVRDNKNNDTLIQVFKQIKKMNNKIDYKAVFNEIWKHRKLYIYILPATAIITSLYIICIPREYVTETKVAPETGSSSQNSIIGSIASSFDMDLSNIESSDAITPMIYPELLEDNRFISELFNIKLKSSDGKIETNLYNYTKKYQKYPWWTICSAWIRMKITPKKNDSNMGKSKKYDPYVLTKNENDVITFIRKSIKVSVDKKTGVITIKTQAQDPLICKTLADSVREHLQQFIIKYRTNKARTDYDYYHKLTLDAKRDYERARELYGSFADANTEIILQSVKSKQDDLENDMQLKFNTYSTMNTQLQAAKARIQERTPAFIIVKGASMPIKPDSPKRMLFVIGMVLLAFIGTSTYILKDILTSK